MAGIEDFFEEQDTTEEVVDINNPEPVPPETPPADPPPEPIVEPPASEVEPPVTPVAPPASENQADTVAFLRQQLQEQAEELKQLRGQSNGLTKALTESGAIDEETLAGLETEESGFISPERIELLSVLQETMKVNPMYSDFEEVCSQENFNLVVDAIARASVQENGGRLTDAIQSVTKDIWSLPNPYKFVYDTLKENHPKYATPAPAPATSQPQKDTPKPPPSLSQVPGGAGSHRDGWTAAKIDALPEDELHTVPKEIYDRYMRNELQ